MYEVVMTWIGANPILVFGIMFVMLIVGLYLVKSKEKY